MYIHKYSDFPIWVIYIVCGAHFGSPQWHDHVHMYMYIYKIRNGKIMYMYMYLEGETL